MELKKGDCLELLRELPDKSVDLVYTDVPYDIEGNGGGGCFGEKKRDYHSEYYSVSNNKTQKLRDYHSEYIDTMLNPNASRISKTKSSSSSSIAEIAFGFDDNVLDELVRVMKKIYIYIWCSKKQIPKLFKYFEKYNCFFDIFCWCKTNPIPACNGTYLSDIEYCLLFREKGTKIYGCYDTKHKWYASPLNVADKKIWEHPTIKPIQIVKNHIYNALPENYTSDFVVLDPFMGSGTTGVACKKLGVDFIGMEVNDKWYEIAKERISKTKNLWITNY